MAGSKSVLAELTSAGMLGAPKSSKPRITVLRAPALAAVQEASTAEPGNLLARIAALERQVADLQVLAGTKIKTVSTQATTLAPEDPPVQVEAAEESEADEEVNPEELSDDAAPEPQYEPKRSLAEDIRARFLASDAMVVASRAMAPAVTKETNNG